MSASTLDPRLVALVARVKRVCGPPPENKLRGVRLLRFEHAYWLEQEDKLFEILATVGKQDPANFLLVAAAAQRYMREMLKQYRNDAAFNEPSGTRRWARQRPEKARQWVTGSLESVRQEIAKWSADMQSALADGHINHAASLALRVIDREAAVGVRWAALTELANLDAVMGNRLASVLAALDGKTGPAVQAG